MNQASPAVESRTVVDAAVAEGTIAERLARVWEQIEAACQAAGRSTNEITLVAVSKTQPVEAILEAVAAGLTDVGENRPEEAVPKIAAVDASLPEAARLRWHMVGHIQSRKARLVVSRFDLIHSVDSLKLAGKLSRLAEEAGRTLDVLLEMNVSGEATKSGWDAVDWDRVPTTRESLWGDIRSILALRGLRLHGLMTVAPLVTDPEMARPTFVALRRLRGALREDFPEVDWGELSMGMTDDFPVAIAEGATIVRIGRAIFGPRVVR